MEKDALRSIRSSSHARTSSERGFALVAAIVLAVLYVALVELLLIDSARELSEARRFRAKVVAAALAENGAELAAAQLINRDTADVNAVDWQGSISGTLLKKADHRFEIIGTGETSGIVKTSARVEVQGRIEGTKVEIEYAVHIP
jgi:type II secretory pathway component PulK